MNSTKMQISFSYMQNYASEKHGSLRYNARPGLPQQLVRAGALAQTLCGNQNGVLTAALDCCSGIAALLQQSRFNTRRFK